jgi:hypothetical protein
LKMNTFGDSSQMNRLTLRNNRLRFRDLGKLLQRNS